MSTTPDDPRRDTGPAHPGTTSDHDPRWSRTGADQRTGTDRRTDPEQRGTERRTRAERRAATDQPTGTDHRTDTIPTSPGPTSPGPVGPDPAAPRRGARSRGDLLQRQKDRFGGMKWGAAFFGWLTAIGTAALLSALVTAVGAIIGVELVDSADQAAQRTDLAQPAALVSAVVAAAVLLVAYYCGGYVAGRMARFSGAKQGVAVWLWTIATTIVVAVLAAVAGDQFDVLSRVDGLPRLPVGEDAVAVTAIITVAAALAITLVGAVLGGLAGMRFHRKIDKADLGEQPG